MSIKFGTDGWRAVIAEDFTFQNVERLAQASADYWKAQPVPGAASRIIIGYDRRFLSDQFARRVAEVAAGNGFEIILANCPTPTPSVSFAVKQQKACGGVMITASHNPARFNGFKLKAHYGGSADPAICQAVEGLIDQNPIRALPSAGAGGPARREPGPAGAMLPRTPRRGVPTSPLAARPGPAGAMLPRTPRRGVPTSALAVRPGPADSTGQIKIMDLRPAHYRAIKDMVDFKLIAHSKLRFAHDALFGVGAGCFDAMLARTTCRVTTLNAAHDPNFGGINPEPIAQNYAVSSAYLKKHPHDLCLVTDGDADRVGGMDGRGNPLTTHQIICLILHHLIANRKARGRVIKALTTTAMVDRICAHYGLELVETPVGFKYICAEMLQPGVLLGFEESGGIGFPQLMPERDGIASGMMLLELLATERASINKLLSRLEKQFGPHHYARLDTHFPLEKRAPLMELCKSSPPSKLVGSPVVEVKSYDGVKYLAQNGSWLMLRGSGTEPILRIYAEASSEGEARRLIGMGVGLTRRV